MTMYNPAGRVAHRNGPSALGPQVTFVVAVLTSFAALTVCTITLPEDLAFPLTSTVLFVLAGLIALIAWGRGPASDRDTVTYWDVAGALTFIGIFAASQIDPDQMLRVVEGRYREN
jgi:prepilin signal peptidase PulO-like enzyme (type II secretory pathway)